MSAIDPITEKPFKHALGTIALLNSTNYAAWKVDCEVVLHGIKAWKIVNEEEKEPEYSDGMSIYERRIHDDFDTRRAQAVAIIYGSCSPEVKIHLNGVKDPVKMWQILKEEMDTASTTVGRLTLFHEFSQLLPVPGQPINNYFSKLLKFYNQLAGTPEAISDMVLKNQIFTTLPEMFKVNIKMLQTRADVTIKQVLSDLRECEQNEALATKPDASSEALYSQQGGRGGRRGGRGG